MAAVAQAQGLPQGCFRNPLDSEIGLSATFAEFRTGHFHAGIDMRTGGQTGLPVHAAADGYVAKVSISPWGGGKILYIKHPNGYTSVYMHLNDYAGAIGRAVKAEQYARRSYSIVKMFAPGELPVKKGDVVAHSGNTGGSGGPHLHFEVRRGGDADLHTHATTINPLLFGLPYKDGVKPVIRGLRIYPEGGEPFEVGKDNVVRVGGPFHLGIYATDAAEGSTAKNGPDRVQVYLDGELFFEYTTRELPLDSSRMVNALLDYSHYARTRQPYLLTRALPGAEGPWVPKRKGDGIIRLKPGTSHRIQVRVYDVKDNIAERTIRVENGEWRAESGERRVDRGERVSYNSPFLISHSSFRISLPAYTLYADDRLEAEAAGGGVSVRPVVNDIPPHLGYTLGLRGSLPGVPAGKTVVVRVDGKRRTAYKTSHADGWHTAQVRDWGRFALAADTVAPTVKTVNFAEGKPFKGSTPKVKISDDLSGIETYNCYMNGEWILAEYDGKTATLAIDAAGRMRPGRNELRVEVSDGAGNMTRRTYTITR